MRYFTDNPLERLMMQKPSPGREAKPPAAPKGHPCHGCGRFGEGCVLPCYRGVTAQTIEGSGNHASCNC